MKIMGFVLSAIFFSWTYGFIAQKPEALPVKETPPEIVVNKLNGGFGQLHEALKKGDLELFKNLVDKGADVNSHGRYTTILIHTLDAGKEEFAKYLVQKGANVNKKYRSTPLASAQTIGMAQFLLSYGADINIFGDDSNTPLSEAARNGNLELCRFFISKGADVNLAGPKSGSPPLHQAKTIEIAELLISSGAKINALDYRGATALAEAAVNGNMEVCRFLVSKGADVKLAGPTSGVTPIHYATKKEIVVMFVEKGADVNIKDGSGSTPLHWAAHRGSLDIAEYLISKGCDVKAKSNTGELAVHSAARMGNLDIFKLLFDKGGYQDLPNKDGETPLYLARANRHEDVAEFITSIDQNSMRAALEQEKKPKKEYRQPECKNVPDNGIIRSETFTGTFKYFSWGDYLHGVFENDKGEEIGPFLGTEESCFLARHVGELLEIQYDIKCEYFREGGGWYPAKYITQIKAKSEDYKTWVKNFDYSRDNENCEAEVNKYTIDY